jgi:hypothetical protein
VFVGIDRRGFCFWRFLLIVTLLPAMDAFDEDGLRSICSDFLTRSAAKAARRSLQWFLAPNLAACSIVHPPLFDDSRRSSSLKCFVSKFLLKVPLSLFSLFYAPSRVDFFCSCETTRFSSSICTSLTSFVATLRKMLLVRGASRLSPMTWNLFNRHLPLIPPALRRASHLDLLMRT